MKVVDTREYISALKELTENGKCVHLQVAGNSMAPFLRDKRDAIQFEKPKRKLKKGDMVFYERKTGQYVMHRICRVTPAGYYMAGDAQCDLEGPIPETAVFALVTSVRRKGRWIGSEDFWWRFFAGVWVWIRPLRHIVRKCYSYIKNNKKS